MWYKTIRLTKKSLFWICALLTGVVISQHRQSIKRGDLAAMCVSIVSIVSVLVLLVCVCVCVVSIVSVLVLLVLLV